MLQDYTITAPWEQVARHLRCGGRWQKDWNKGGSYTF